MSKNYLLIGASAASIGAARKLCLVDPDARLTLICSERELPYNKCLLADFLSGIREQGELAIYKAHERITLELGSRVIAIDPAAKQVTSNQEKNYSYDALFLGTGSSPFIPAISGIFSAGVFTFHTLADVLAIQKYVQENRCKKAVIIGAGLSGIEAADALHAQGLAVTLVEKNNRILPSMLTEPASEFLQNHLRTAGVSLALETGVVAIESNAEKVTEVYCDNNLALSADLVIIATGLRPNIQLCAAAGIAYDYQGIMVDEYLATSVPGIYAGGDVIQVTDRLTGKQTRSCLWPDAMQQGAYAALAMAGKPMVYPGPSLVVSSAFFGLKLARAGLIMPDSKRTQGASFYHEISLTQGALTGFQMLGQGYDFPQLRRLILTGVQAGISI